MLMKNRKEKKEGREQCKAEPYTLYIVATPIGNVSDISFRAKGILETVDYIAAEDTRVSKKLINALSLSKSLTSLNEYASEKKIASLVEKIKSGSSVAYLSDAGTPAICDPGAVLVKEAYTACIRVVPIPGPSALTTLLSVSGMRLSTIIFHGFFPRKAKEREQLWEKISHQKGLHFFFESPKRMEKTISFLQEKCPEEKMTCGRELSKLFESIYHGSVEEVAKTLKKENAYRGEFSFVLHIAHLVKRELSEEKLRSLLQDLSQIGASRKVLVRVAQEHGLSRKKAYALSLEY